MKFLIFISLIGKSDTAASGGSSNGLLNFDNVFNMVIDNCYIFSYIQQPTSSVSNIISNSLYLGHCDFVTIQNCKILNIFETGLRSNVSSSSNYGIRTSTTSNMKIKNCNITLLNDSESAGTYIMGIQAIYQSLSNRKNSLEILDNVILCKTRASGSGSSTRVGVYVNPSGTTTTNTYINISNNNFSNDNGIEYEINNNNLTYGVQTPVCITSMPSDSSVKSIILGNYFANALFVANNSIKYSVTDYMYMPENGNMFVL